MDQYTATEQAYKNGYEQGKKNAVVHGRWIERGIADYQCSKCGFRFTSGDKISDFLYCRCGAKMDGGTDK